MRILICILLKISIMPTVHNCFLLRNILRVGIPKSTVLVIIFRFFMWPLSLRNSGPRNIIHLQCFEKLSKKRPYYLIKSRWIMELIHRLLIMKWHPRKRKIAVPRLKKKMHCYSLKNQDDALFRNSPKRPAFVLIQLKTMLNAIGEVIVSPATWVWNRLHWFSCWLHFFEIIYCGPPNLHYAHIQL